GEPAMRNLLAFAAAAVLTVAALGWYLDWYKIQVAPAPNGHRNVSIDINAKQIGQDLHRGGEKLLESGGKQLQRVMDKTAKTPADPPPNPGGPPRANGARGRWRMAWATAAASARRYVVPPAG